MSANRSGSYGGGLVDPSNLHLKKELTQIRKAARALRDPGTTSSWRSPLSSSRSTTAVAIAASITTSPSNHYNHHYSYSVEENNVNEISNNVSGSSNNHNTSRRKEKKVFLYNWKTQRSESERSASVENTRRLNLNGDGDDSLSDALNDRDLNNADNRYAFSSSSKMFSNCKGATSLMKKKPHSSSSALKLGQQRHLSLPDQYDEVNSDDMVVKSSSKLLRGGSRKDDSSYCYSTTPALSTSSFSKYWIRNPSTVGSWDAGSLNYDDDDDDLQGCGIPCYWSSSKRSTPKRGGVCGSCYSPSFSDTSRRKGTSMLKKRHVKKSSQSQGLVPLLTNGAESRDPSSIGTDDELSTNYGELDLEASSRLDGRRWSTSQHGLELVAVEEGDGDSPSSLDNINCFSHKYKPLFFEDLVGQNVVVQSLVTAITRSRIAPIYLFQGPRGTGKTSTARVFAAALNCLATGDPKPCGICRECADFILGKRHVITEITGSNKKGIDKVRTLIKKLNLGIRVGFTRHEVYVIDECHLLPSKLWVSFQKFLEEPPPSVVFIFITTDLDNVPRAVLSRCQKYIFGKIKESEIVNRLRKISVDENLDVEKDALDLIASNVQGSLRDAETMLDQLSLLGNKITTDLVNELVGVVSDDQLLELLELAMSSNTAETVKRAREVMESGVDPMLVMSQMATLIMDIIAGTYQVVDGRKLSETEIERLKHALKLLCESEKQLRLSSERSTWFTATLLQLGLAYPTPSGSSRRQSSRSQNSTSPQDALLSIMNGGDDDVTNSTILDDIWARCIDKCHSKTLRHLLHTYGKLVSISEDKGIMVASIVFGNKDIKSRAERFVSSITNSFEIVLHRNIQVRIGVEEPGPKPGNPKPGNPVQRIESIIHEQRLETAWLQTAEKGGTPGLLKPEAERNQVLPRDQMEEGIDEEKWKDNVVKMNDGNGILKDQIGRHYSMSPSFLHDSNLAAKGYESGSGGRGCFCFNNRRKRRGKMKAGTPVGPRRGAKFLLFGECGKAGRSRR